MEIAEKLNFIDVLIMIPILILIVVSYSQKLAPTIHIVKWIVTLLILKTGLSMIVQDYVLAFIWCINLTIWIYNYYALKLIKRNEHHQRHI